MLDFFHDDRISPRRAPQLSGRLALNESDLRLDTSREAWVLAIKAQVNAGIYLTDEKLDGALEQMLSQAAD